MNRSDLVRQASRQSQLSQVQIEATLDLLLEMIAVLLTSGDGTLTIKNFGRFELRYRPESIRKNPKTGEDIKVPAKRAVLFQPAKAFKARINDDMQ